MLAGRPTQGLQALVTAILLSLPAAAFAGVPVVLPSGEDTALWTPYLGLVDFELSDGAVRGGARVEFRVADESWTVHVTDASGTVQTRTVAAPTTGRDREDLVSVAHSLLNPASWAEPSWADLSSALPGGGDVFEAPLDLPPLAPAPAVLPPRPAPPADPPVPAPKPALAGVEPVAPTLITPTPAILAGAPTNPPVEVAPPEVPASGAGEPSTGPTSEAVVDAAIPETLPTPSPRPLSTSTVGLRTPLQAAPAQILGWVRAGAGYGGRQGVAGGVALDAAGGVVFDAGFRIGAEVAGITPGSITGIPGKRRSGDVDVGVLLNYVQPTIGLMFGVQGGIGFRIFEQDTRRVSIVTTPWFGPVVGWNIRLAKLPISLEPYGMVRIDTRPIDIEILGSDAPPIRRGVIAWRGGLRVVWSAGQAKARSSVIHEGGSPH